MDMEDLETIKRSALWAAYGDAVGFITELTDEDKLIWRAGLSRIETTVPWKRRVGGKFGVIVELPAGCYSDDTQLRLATSRAIRGDGKFDVEAFSKIEIPVWLSYALGAGKGSKAAAVSLSKRDISWINNFFEDNGCRYIDNGGNGAAMRIQPHIWASVDRNNIKTFLPDVIKNAICTHGHPRGILGAVFHALSLSNAIQKGIPPGPNEWKDFVVQFDYVAEFIRSDKELNDFWLPTWEKLTGQQIENTFKKVTEECLKDIELAQQLANEKPMNQYDKLVRDSGGMEEQFRGSGTKTAIFASFLAWVFKDNPLEAIITSINLLGSDTDTIATMAGAILGAIAKENPPGEICDKTYIEEEASRLCAVSHGLKSKSFTYPDLLKWNVTSVQGNFVGTANNQLAISGFGYVKPSGKLYEQKGKNAAVWQWLELSFGQHILAKRSSKSIKIPITNIPLQNEKNKVGNNLTEGVQESLFDKSREKRLQHDNTQKHTLTIDEATKKVINLGFDTSTIGSMLIEFSEREDGIELAIGFSSIIAKALRARAEREKRQKP
ncbi:MAG: ADP-ribosylglycohydrolase family protein [Nitrospinae bacterium]|nr:ADP-ribosylglycohydrolase family protein [Nitrospinota bacterium]